MHTRGFSLIELLIYMAILSLMSVVLANSYISLMRGRGHSEARTEVGAAMRFAVEHITQDVQSATGVIVPGSVGTTGATLQLAVSTSTVLYDVSGGRLRRTVGAQSPDFITGVTVFVDPPLFTRIENYNSVLRATTTSIQTILTVHYNSSSSESSYIQVSRNTTPLR